MFDRGGDDVPAARFGHHAYATNRQTVGLGSAGGENDLVSACANQRRYLSPRAIDSGPRFLSEEMNAGSVTKLFLQERHH